MKENIYKIAPHFFQNLMITLFNIKAYKMRYGGDYEKYKKEKENNRNLSLEELKIYQKRRFKKFIDFVIEHSEYYKKNLSSIPEASNIDNITSLPIVSKEDLRKNINKVRVQTSERLVTLKTGGTTGKSLEVKNFKRNRQEFFGFLDNFRSQYGYKLGEPTAWFSGKKLLNNRDLRKNRFWKTDFYYRVRYYSTFHIKRDYLKFYLEDLIKFKPKFMVGFPSTMLEIAKYGLDNNITFPENTIRAIFPTAESITPYMREIIEGFFKTKIYNQYASSEGAPFIFECREGNLHIEMQSGVFEVLDENNNPTNSGRLVVTSFINEGTPLIRYDIGDSVIMEDLKKTCACGNNNPMVKEILGRKDDFIYSPLNGKINLGNISNTLKGVYGIEKFQVIQNELNSINFKVVRDKEVYSKKSESIFLENWIDRVGTKMKINIEYVPEIPSEKSGKYRMVKNNIKHLI